MEQKNQQYMDSGSGFNSLTKTFHSLRLPLNLPEEDTPLSATEYAFSRRANLPWPDSIALINSSTATQPIFYSHFIQKTNSLAAYLQKVIKLSKNDVAFVLSPNSVQVPILYFSLLSLDVIVSPANPISTESEISRLIHLSKPVIAFATSSTVHKLPKLEHQTILIDSPEFDSVMVSSKHQLDPVRVSQSDLAAILYSSGTTGKVKGVMLTHRNLIAQVASYCASWQQQETPAAMLFTMPYFHVFGFLYCVRSVALSEMAVVMERFELKKMLRAVEEFRVTHTALTPPVVVAMLKDGLTDGYDLSSLEGVVCGAAPLGKDSIAAFMARFPKVVFLQSYGLTESTAGIFRMVGLEESKHLGSVGRLSGGFEAKIVEPETGDALPPLKQGELWIRGPTIMKGYIRDAKATSETLLKDGWMRTGDLCYIDEGGFLFIVDRLKELIKYKGFQVAALLGGARQGRVDSSRSSKWRWGAEKERRSCSGPVLAAAAAAKERQQQRRRRSNQLRSRELCWWIERAAVLVDRASCAGGSSERLWSREKAAAAATRIEPTAIERAAVLVARASGGGGNERLERRCRQRAARASGGGGSERLWSREVRQRAELGNVLIAALEAANGSG